MLNDRPDEPVDRNSGSVPAAGGSTGGITAISGHVVAVSGSQAEVRLTAGRAGGGPGDPDPTVGTVLSIRTRRAILVGVLVDIRASTPAAAAIDGPPGPIMTGRVDLLGEIVPGAGGAREFEHGVIDYPAVGDPVGPLGADELRLVFAGAGPDTIEIGVLQQARSIAARVRVDEMVRKHFVILGSTGSGKSSALALVLRQTVQARPDLRVVLVDPHNEYGRCFEDRAHVVGPANLALPYWMLAFDELVEIVFGRRSGMEEEIGILADTIPEAKKSFARTRLPERTSYRQIEPEGPGYTVDTPVPYNLEQLVGLIEARMGKLENRGIALSCQRLLLRLDLARRNPRYAFIFETGTEGDAMVDFLCHLLRLQADGRPITVLQLASFPAEVFDIIVSVLFRMAFEFGLWSGGARPLLLVCEEAHNYVNADPALGFPPARAAVSRIAKEGRKHGVFLGLVTQRPSELDPTLVSQCSTVFAMRMANERDQAIVRAAISDAGSRLLGFLPSLRTREALAFGEGVPLPARLRFGTLPAALLPQSDAAPDDQTSGSAAIDRKFVADVVRRWRGAAVRPQLGASSPDQGFADGSWADLGKLSGWTSR